MITTLTPMDRTSILTKVDVRVVPAGSESTGACTCCGRPIYSGHGDLLAAQGPVASFWYRWSEGHDGRFVLGIGRYDAEGLEVPGIVVVQARLVEENIEYSIVAPDDSPWNSLGRFGGPLSREAVIEQGFQIELFHIVDAIAANEPRISSRMSTSIGGLH
jgi:hypothetical protein